MTSHQIIIGCLGDSLTDGHPAYSCYHDAGKEAQSCYQYWLGKMAKNEFGDVFKDGGMELFFLNKGICGEVTSQINSRLYPEIIDLCRDKFNRNPDAVIIIAGTNDLGWGIDPVSVVANLKEMHLCCAGEGISSLGATVPPTRFETEPDYHSRKLQINVDLTRFFKENKIACADLYTKMGDAFAGGNLKPALDAGDGLHFSVQGYKRMGEIIYEDGIKVLLKSILAGRNE
ncbi:GDSL-type esterase/lipase family protein [Fibrobacterota bacterium]